MYQGTLRILVRTGFALALMATGCSSDDDAKDEPQAGTAGGNGGTSGGAGGAGASGAGSSGAGASGSGGDGSGSGGGGAGAGSGGEAASESDAGPDGSGIVLDDGRALSSLSTVETKELCTQLLAIADTIADEDDVARLGCVLLASVFGGSGGTFNVAACEETVRGCLLDGEGVVSSMRCRPARLHEATVGCELTIAQYRECVVASSAQLAEWIDTFSCQSLADPETPSPTGIDPSAASTPECAPVMAACPLLFEPEGGPAADGCDDTCSDAHDDFCDDGGPGSLTRFCAIARLHRCGPR